MNGKWANQYEAAIMLLKQLQTDYRSAREQLQDVSSRFAEKETLAGWQIRLATNAEDKINASQKYGTSIATHPATPEQALRQGSELSSLVEKRSKPTVQVSCLGTFQVWVNWKAIECWRSNKAKSLLKYLITQQVRSVPKDILMEVLWPGCAPSLANNNLKATVRIIRRTLSSAYAGEDDFPWVLFDDGNYMINTDIDLWLDVEQFEYHWHSGRQLEKEHKLGEAIIEYEAAEALYKGDYLQDDLYEDWTSLRREALKDIYLTILNRLAEHSMQGKDYQDCIAYCQKILAKDHCREDAYRHLMFCYSRLGQRNRAISWYHLAEKNIKRELDISPEQRTKAIYQKLRSDEEYV